MGKPRMEMQKYGRTYQLRLESPDDLAHLQDMNASHWMANSAPLEVFACDRAFLEFVDSDKNGRIRCDEVQRAVDWLLHVLGDYGDVGAESGILRLDHISAEHEEGGRLRSAVERILTNLGKSDDNAVSLADVRNTKTILSAAEANGDGIIPSSAAKDAEIAQFIKDIMATVGSEKDASGGAGVTEGAVEKFLKEAGAYLAWHDKGRAADSGGHSDKMPLGEATEAAHLCLEAIRVKVDEYFRFCATIAYDPASAAAFRLNLAAGEGDTEAFAQKLEAGAIAQPSREAALDLRGDLNPAYREQVRALRENTIVPILGEEVSVLTEESWRRVCNALAAHAAWEAEKPETKTESLGVEKLRQYLEPRYQEEVRTLVAADVAVAQEIAAIGEVERLILYQRWLLEFANNFVSFPRLYDPEHRALFEAGTLVMDGRQFTLCVSVGEGKRADHAKLAANSRLFILYLELTQGTVGERKEIAAAVTDGGKGNLYVGKHGIFVDRGDRLWDACVTQMVENPISFGEALVAPFVRMGTLVQSQIEKISGSGQSMVEAKLTERTAGVAATVQTAAQQGPVGVPAQAAAAPPAHGGRDMLIGGSLAFAAVGSTLAFITKTLHDMENPLLIVVKVACLVVLVVLVPMTISAWVKLRQRDVGTLLEACGWAINGRLRLTRVIQGIFTRRPRLPANASKQRFDGLRAYGRIGSKPFVWAGRHAHEAGRNFWDGV